MSTKSRFRSQSYSNAVKKYKVEKKCKPKCDDCCCGPCHEKIECFTKKSTNKIQSINLLSKLAPCDIRYDSQFGHNISMSGDGSTLVVGSPSITDGYHKCTGEIHVFTKCIDEWTQETTLNVCNLPNDSELGFSVSISDCGNIIVAGAPAYSFIDRNNQIICNAGAVFVFVKHECQWKLICKLLSPTIKAGDRFGHSVDISGNGHVIAVGSPCVDGTDTQDNGSTHVFVKCGCGYRHLQELIPEDLVDGMHFGFSVSLSCDGDCVVVGAPSNKLICDDTPATGSTDTGPTDSCGTDLGTLIPTASTDNGIGLAFVFCRTHCGYILTEILEPGDGNIDDMFGTAVKISGNGCVIAIGSPCHDIVNVGTDTGPTETGSTDTGSTDTCPTDTVGTDMVGTDTASTDTGAIIDAGAVYTYKKDKCEWKFIEKVTSNIILPNAKFGTSLSLSCDGSVLVVGAPDLDDGIETVCIFVKRKHSWEQQACLKGDSLNSNFGKTVDVDKCGKFLAIGAPLANDGIGQVCVYELTSCQLVIKCGLNICSNRVILKNLPMGETNDEMVVGELYIDENGFIKAKLPQ